MRVAIQIQVDVIGACIITQREEIKRYIIKLRCFKSVGQSIPRLRFFTGEGFVFYFSRLLPGWVRSKAIKSHLNFNTSSFILSAEVDVISQPLTLINTVNYSM